MSKWKEHVAAVDINLTISENLSPFKCETKAKSLRGSLERKTIYFQLMSVAKAKAEEKPKVGVTLT